MCLSLDVINVVFPLVLLEGMHFHDFSWIITTSMIGKVIVMPALTDEEKKIFDKEEEKERRQID